LNRSPDAEPASTVGGDLVGQTIQRVHIDGGANSRVVRSDPVCRSDGRALGQASAQCLVDHLVQGLTLARPDVADESSHVIVQPHRYPHEVIFALRPSSVHRGQRLMPIVETVTGRIARKYRRPPQERLISEALVCDDGRMRWLVDVEGDRRDIEQLLAQRVEGVIGAAEAHMVLLEVVDPDHADYSDDALAAGRSLIDSALRRLNGFGRLRWGRAFTALTIRGVSYVAQDGSAGQVWFGSASHTHLPPDEFGDLMERLGRKRPNLPKGLEDVNALDPTVVVDLAAHQPEVARVLHFVELMLAGDEEIDWAAGYAALEVIEQSAKDQGVSGHELGWWTQPENKRFRQMANSFEAAGIKSRHPGQRYRAPTVPMSPKEGAWFVRAAVSRWIRWLSERA